MNTAEYIVKRLEEFGINDFFGVPGDYNFNLLYAIESNPNTKWVGCTNELNAGYAADGYARVRGYGAVITTYGVGELSAINAIAGCCAENIPVVHIVGMPSSKNIEKKSLLHHNLQETNYRSFSEIYKSITEKAVILTRDNAKIEIDKALKFLLREKKPVYLAIPSDIAEMEISDRNILYEWVSDKDTLEKVSQKIVQKIQESTLPLILGDVLIKRFDAEIEFKEFVEKSGLPITNFLMGVNLIDMDYEMYLGGYYANFRNPIAEKYMNDTDCLISVGPIYSDVNSFGQKLPYKINNHIAIYGTYTYVEGKKYNNIKMADVLDSITKLIESRHLPINKPNIGYKKRDVENKPLDSDYIYPRLQEFIKENDIVFAETGTVPFGVAAMKLPNSTIIEYQLLWGSIGWATSAVLGACIAKPNARVILITGEGAHQMSAMEVGTMIRYGVKPVIVVINNNGYATERILSRSPKDDFNNILEMNYAKFARVFSGDVWSTKASTDDEFDKSLKVTQIMNKMCYIEAVTEFMDMPSLTKDILSSFKDGNEKNSTKKIKEKKADSYKEIKLMSDKSDIKYETIVHKTFTPKGDAE